LVIILIDAVKTLDINMKGVMERLNSIKVDQGELRSYYRDEDL
jgi:GTP-binding protein Era